jgi:ABC-type dipeptide/oligopeptide/nickel transport system permease component
MAHRLNTTSLAGTAVAAFLLLVLLAGSLVFWIGVPVVTLWALGRVTDSTATHFVLGLVGVPVAMVLFAPFLLWVNALFLRVTGVDEDLPPRRRPPGPLEPILIASLAVAVVALSVWFFAFAHTAPRQVI